MLLCASFKCALARQRTTLADGFTLIEMMMATMVLGLLVGLAIPGYNGIVERLKVGEAVRDLVMIAGQVNRFRSRSFRLPDSLDELSGIPRLDPWQNPYEYLNFASGGPGVNGRIRKDHNLHPLNSDLDLYSKGPDGESRSPLTARASRDDIIYARDGGFVGKATDF